MIAVDPLTPPYYWPLAFVYLTSNRFDLGIELLKKNYKMAPDIRWTPFFLAQFLARNGQKSEALILIEKTIEIDAEDVVGRISVFLRHLFIGEKELATEAMHTDLRDYLWNDPEGPWWLTGWYSLLEEKDEAFSCLEHAIERGWINYPLFNKIDPFLENIRGEPRFKKLMGRVKYEWDQFEV